MDNNIIKKRKLFNPEGNDELANRKIIGGDSTNLFNLNNVKYKWAVKMYRSMMENFWIPEKVSLVDDVVDYQKLPKAELRAYNGILSFLVFLDSIQTNNLPNIGDFITAPEINLALSVQAYQEAIHSQSYAYIIESAIPVDFKNKIYDFWRTDKKLFDRNKYIASVYQDFADENSEEKFVKALIADYILEGIYFYNGFNFFYNLAQRNLMKGTKDVIKYIHRDELTHCVLFRNLILDLKQERPELFDEEMIYAMFKEAVDHEISWAEHIIGEDVIGMSPKSIKDYTHWLANSRLASLKLKEIFPKVEENPFKHLNKIADVESAGDSKGNFFEATVTSYNQSSIFSDWDDI